MHYHKHQGAIRMIRLYLPPVIYKKIEEKLEQIGVYKTDNLKLFIEAIIWRIRTGIPWRDLPDFFGPWKTIYNRFNAWSECGIWEELECAFLKEPDLEWLFIDGSYVKAHQHASGSREDESEKTIGLSRGGNTTKIHAAVDAHGNPVKILITAGNIHDTTMLPEFLDVIKDTDNVICDKGYDSKKNRELIESAGSCPQIPLRKGSVSDNSEFDKSLYGHRHLVENFFARIKHFRAVATRYDKLTRNFSAVISIASMLVWLK